MLSSIKPLIFHFPIFIRFLKKAWQKQRCFATVLASPGAELRSGALRAIRPANPRASPLIYLAKARAIARKLFVATLLQFTLNCCSARSFVRPTGRRFAPQIYFLSIFLRYFLKKVPKTSVFSGFAGGHTPSGWVFASKHAHLLRKWVLFCEKGAICEAN